MYNVTLDYVIVAKCSGVEGWLDPPLRGLGLLHPLGQFILGSLDPSQDRWTLASNDQRSFNGGALPRISDVSLLQAVSK